MKECEYYSLIKKMMEKYDLSEEDAGNAVKIGFTPENTGCVYQCAYELGAEEFEDIFGIGPHDPGGDWVDFEGYGEARANEIGHELPSGKVICWM